MKNVEKLMDVRQSLGAKAIAIFMSLLLVLSMVNVSVFAALADAVEPETPIENENNGSDPTPDDKTVAQGKTDVQDPEVENESTPTEETPTVLNTVENAIEVEAENITPSEGAKPKNEMKTSRATALAPAANPNNGITPAANKGYPVYVYTQINFSGAASAAGDALTQFESTISDKKLNAHEWYTIGKIEEVVGIDNPKGEANGAKISSTSATAAIGSINRYSDNSCIEISTTQWDSELVRCIGANGYNYKDKDKHPDSAHSEATWHLNGITHVVKYTWIDSVDNQELAAKVSWAKSYDESWNPEAPEHEGYEFTGWTVTGNNSFGDVTITANYKQKTGNGWVVLYVDNARREGTSLNVAYTGRVGSNNPSLAGIPVGTEIELTDLDAYKTYWSDWFKTNNYGLNKDSEGYEFVKTVSNLDGNPDSNILKIVDGSESYTTGTKKNVFEFHFQPKEASIVFETDGGTSVETLMGRTNWSVKTAVENASLALDETTKLPITEKTGYTLAGWYADESLTTPVTALPEEFAVGTTTYYAKWEPATDTEYTVRHWFQNIENDEYAENVDLAETQTGTTNQLTAAVAKDVTGFTAQAIDQKEIAADGSTVVDVYYNRNTYDVTYAYAEGTLEDAPELPATATVKYGASVTVAGDVTLSGYAFVGWVTDDVTVGEDGTFAMPAGDVTLKGAFTAKNDISYTVKYLDATDTELVSPKTVTEQTMADTVKETAEVIPGYTPDAETKSLTLEAEGNEIVFRYTANTDTAYTVEYYQQNLEDDGYALVSTEDKAGTTGASVTAEQKEFDGFTLNAGAEGTVASGTIAGDGSTTLKLYYDRNIHSVIYKVTGDFFANDSFVVQESIRYGALLTQIADDMTQQGYTWSGWSTLPATMPDADVTVEGSYSARTDLTYTVNYLEQGTNNVLFPASTASNGGLGATVQVSALDIPGYALIGDETQSITITANEDENVIIFYYATDQVGTDPAQPGNGDGVPDMYQVRVDFAANNGTVSIPYTYVTLYDAAGNYAENGTGYLAAQQVATATAADGYDQASLSWDTTPATTVAITGAVKFTASFDPTQAPNPNPNPNPNPTPTPGGDGGTTGGAGTTPTTPDTTVIPDTPTPLAAAPAPAAAAPAAETIADDANPLAAAPGEETIDDEGNPLASFELEPQCWVHWLMILGIIVTVFYGLGVVINRRKDIQAMDEIEAELTGQRVQQHTAAHRSQEI